MSETIKTIEIKKSELAMYKGLGQTNVDLAKRYGVTTAEIKDALVTFGMAKGKTLSKDYQVSYINDMEEEVPQADEPQQDETPEYEEQESE